MICEDIKIAQRIATAGWWALFTVLVTFVLASGIESTARADAVKEVGWVERIDGPSNHITIINSENQLSAKLLAPLHENDRVVVKEENAKLVARVAGERVTVTKDNSPYVVGNAPQTPSVADNAASWLASFLTTHHDEEVQYGSVPLITRGRTPPPVIGVVSDDPSRPSLVLAGRRPLFFSITGGRAPYRVHLTNQEGKVAAYREFIPDRQARLTRFFLREGNYKLQLWDSRQRAWTGYIRAVLPSQAPKKVRLSSRKQGGEDLRGHLLHAAEISMIENGAWQLESYQRAVHLPEDFYPAKVFRSALINGQVPVAKKP